MTEVAFWRRRQQARASREQGYLDGVLRTAAAVGAGWSSNDSLINHVCRQIVEVLHSPPVVVVAAGYLAGVSFSGVGMEKRLGETGRGAGAVGADIPTDKDVPLPPAHQDSPGRPAHGCGAAGVRRGGHKR